MKVPSVEVQVYRQTSEVKYDSDVLEVYFSWVAAITLQKTKYFRFVINNSTFNVIINVNVFGMAFFLEKFSLYDNF